MKQLLTLFALCIIGSHTFAQQTTTSRTPGTDTVRAKTVNNGKIKMVNGTPMSSGLDIYHNLFNSSNYSIFVNAIRTAGLIQTFTSRGPITVFVPDNAAFGAMPEGKMDTLMKANHTLELNNFVTYYALRGDFKAKDIAKLIHDNNGQAEFIMISGGKLTAHIDANRNIVLVDENGGQSIVSTFDIPQSNGMAHLITRTLMPKYKVI